MKLPAQDHPEVIQVWLTPKSIFFLPHYQPRVWKEQRPESRVLILSPFQNFKVRATLQSLKPRARVAREQESGGWGSLARQMGEAGSKGPVVAVQPVGLLTHTLAAGSCAHVGQGENWAKDFVLRTLADLQSRPAPSPSPIRADWALLSASSCPQADAHPRAWHLAW